jgi:hypothetical protein
MDFKSGQPIHMADLWREFPALTIPLSLVAWSSRSANETSRSIDMSPPRCSNTACFSPTHSYIASGRQTRHAGLQIPLQTHSTSTALPAIPSAMPSSPTSYGSSPTSSSSSSSASPPPTTRRRPRVSAEHTLERVRENQRRHRARRRDQLASLEQKLANTNRLLAEAREQITILQAERDTANAFFCLDLSKHLDVDAGIGRAVRDACTRAHVGEEAGDARGCGDRVLDVDVDVDVETTQSVTSTSTSIAADVFSPVTTSQTPSTTEPALAAPLAVGPPPCCTDTPLLLPTAGAVDPQCVSCSTRPPPAPSESTTLCVQAFAMISQVNFRNVDAVQVRAWLAQGYRRAGRAGEGCSVENSVLWGVLDYISGM